MPIRGTLVAESLRVGTPLDAVELIVRKVWRQALDDVGARQPGTWTFLEFEVADDAVERLVARLRSTLDDDGGWYCDFQSDAETFVVFSERAFRYPRGDSMGRRQAEAYARSVGVPEAQLDWPT
jgi:hypothetical protein